MKPLLVILWLVGQVTGFLSLQKLSPSCQLSATARTIIEYSYNFRRHCVWEQQGRNRTILESYQWLDEAVGRYPLAEFMSIPSTLAQWPVAGLGMLEECPYPFEDDTANDDWRDMERFLQTELGWFPKQIEQLKDQWVDHLCCSVLRERIRFLLAPVPEDRILQQVNQSSLSVIIDWPVQLYRYHCGAGMSIAQVSHALQLLPELALPYPTPLDRTPLLSFLYDQTPSVVVDMARTQMDPYLTGVDSISSVSPAYLHWRGWEWPQCRVMAAALYAFGTLAVEPWDWGPAGPMRRESIDYLQARLQVRAGQLHAMVKTQPKLTGYSVPVLQRSLDALQSMLGLSSAEVQTVVLRMPSLLGTSVKGMEERVRFWTTTVGLVPSQVKAVVTRTPALLQYQVKGNLEPKLDFFLKTLELAREDLVRITLRYPELWGRSQQKHYLPLVAAFTARCGLTRPELGEMVARAPALLLCNWKGNLSVKLDYLQDRLQLSNDELKEMIQATPMMLMQGIKSSLDPKIALIESAGDKGGRSSRSVLVRNPSLLLNGRSTLEQRVERAKSASFDEALGSFSSTPVRGEKRRRPVWLVRQGSVEQEFTSVGEAAQHAGLSQSNMYRVLRQEGRTFDGRQYVYARDTVGAKNKAERRYTAVQATDNGAGPTSLVIYTSGRAFPPEARVRGQRRGGGMVLAVPEWSLEDWRPVGSRLFQGARSKLLPGGCLILGYPYIRPSRQRCSLYVCREALRLAREWVCQHPQAALKGKIVIVTDSNYVADLLSNTTRLYKWGSDDKAATFYVDGDIERYRANPDILHPLARTYYKLVSSTNVTVEFGRAMAHRIDYSQLTKGAQLAALRMYDQSR